MKNDTKTTLAEKGLLSTKKVADMCGVSARCVSNDVRNGVLKAKSVPFARSPTGAIWGITEAAANAYCAAYGKQKPKKSARKTPENGTDARQLYVPVGTKLHKRVQNLKDSQITKCSAADVVAALLAEALETRGY